MKRHFKWNVFFSSAAIVALLLPLAVGAQKKEADKKPVHAFTVDLQVKRTPVKDQFKTGTCWDHATLSFLESELLRLGRGEFDLSEMFIVRHTYPRKALNYIRHHGRANFAEGGQSHDVLETIRRHGIVPDSVYSGLNIGESRHNHGELDAVLKAMLDAVVKAAGGRLTPRWPEAVEAVLDVYLGQAPVQFEYGGRTYSPKSFWEMLGLNPDDYIELTSYSHHPFYQKFVLEIPDNWNYNGNYYNLPIDDFEAVIDYALKKGYSVAWDGDVSERDISSSETGYAVVPAKDWEDKTQAERDAKPTEPEPEKEVTQELRQKTFDDFSSTDDHLMHIVGLAHNQKGTKFYLTKNSGGTDRKNEGYVYMSRSYVRLKTLALMVHKNSLPPGLAQKLGVK